MTRTDETTETQESSPISRRSVLAASGSAAVGLTVFTGSAAAHEVSTIAFCGCTQVTVYGAFLLGRDDDENVSYQAVMYCDGEIIRRTLTGSQTRLNYDMDADESLEGQDCQIIALEGQTFDAEEGTTTFTICNEHCPANCASKGLDDQQALDNANPPIETCDDPDSISSGGSDGGIERQTITIHCSGCGREEPGHPGRGKGRGKGRGS
jgi:hypothetical protein